jgi:hypothetical protein
MFVAEIESKDEKHKGNSRNRIVLLPLFYLKGKNNSEDLVVKESMRGIGF